MAAYTIYTGGPVIHKEMTLPAVKKYVEEHAPMKRGWTGEWEEHPKYTDYYRYRRFNSMGKHVKGYDVVVFRD